MPDNDGGPPPKHFGDYPNGSYWTAEGPTGSAEDDALDFTVEGNSIKFMWDYGVVVPLWDGNGLVPQEPKWLHNALGLSDALIRDLRDWGTDMDHLDTNPPLRTENAYLDLDQRARVLVDRLRAEVGSRFRVLYKPW